MPLPEPGLLPDELVKTIARTLRDARVPHAFGGALALVYWSEPRGTTDIDINIFLPASEAERVFEAAAAVGVVASAAQRTETLAREQVRLDWSGTYVDLFFAYDPFHESCRERAVDVDFFGETLSVLSAEDIVLFKTLFNRPKDWIDIEQLLAVQGPALDEAYARDWIARMLAPDDSARQHLEQLLADARSL